MLFRRLPRTLAFLSLRESLQSLTSPGTGWSQAPAGRRALLRLVAHLEVSLGLVGGAYAGDIAGLDRTGARGHATFGGRLSPDASGFPASAMAKKQAGDWRDPAQVRAWALLIARQLQRETAAPTVA